MDLYQLSAVINKVDIEMVALASIEKTADVLAEYNKDQLLKGKRSDNTKLPKYSKRSQSVFGKPNSSMILKDKGIYHDSFKANISRDIYEIKADDPNNLKGRYGEDILGVSTENEGNYSQDVLLPEMLSNLEKAGLNIN
jgi:hypothetical protein